MFVMGTAGHVDHGKSTLVTALSGIDPDRLPEEKARGMTIDLGFAWMTTNSGKTVGIVDVPGHERFVKNMIAGVGAIDFVLLVIAADDGWMPQTAEHLAILKFLRVQRGIVVVTKKSLAKPDWLELVMADAQEQVQGAFPAQSEIPIIAVDSLSGDGLSELKAAIDQMVASLPPRPDCGKPRLYIDRVFAMTGRGAVVTGTLIDGSLAVGQTVGIVPGDLKPRIRELQIHKQTVEIASPGQRLAVNLAGIDAASVSRGQALVAPTDTETVDRIWAHVALLPDAQRPLEAQREFLVMLGTSEPAAFAYPLEADIPPGGDGLCELRLREPIKARLKDRFVLRWPTPQVTIGGGEVLDLGGTRRRHHDPAWIVHLHKRIDASLAVYRATELATYGYRERANFLGHASFARADIEADLALALADQSVIESNGWLIDPHWLADVQARLHEILSAYHRESPYLAGLNQAELQDRLHVPTAPLGAVLARMLERGELARRGEAHSLAGHKPSLPTAWAGESERLWKTLVDGGVQPPVREELEAVSPHGSAIVAYWVAEGRAVSLGDGVILASDAFEHAKARVIEALQVGKSLTAGQLREVLQTTRRYAVPILEALDRAGITHRIGDERVLVKLE